MFLDSTWPHREGTVHPIPIQVYNVHNVESLKSSGTRLHLRPDFHFMGTDKDHKYIIGIIIPAIPIFGTLYPLLGRREDLHNQLERVKIRIDGSIANVTEPIYEWDRLNDLFGQKFGSEHIVSVEVHGPTQ